MGREHQFARRCQRQLEQWLFGRTKPFFQVTNSVWLALGVHVQSLVLFAEPDNYRNFDNSKIEIVYVHHRSCWSTVYHQASIPNPRFFGSLFDHVARKCHLCHDKSHRSASYQARFQLPIFS